MAALLALLTAGAASLGSAASAGQSGNAADGAPSISGIWNATVGYGAVQVPFRFGIGREHGQISGWFFNGDERIVSDSGRFDGGHLLLEFPSYGRRVDAQLEADGTLRGSYGPAATDSSLRTYPFVAQRAATVSEGRGVHAPAIAGVWIVPTDSDKAGEKAWRLIVRQAGARISAAILRVDGDSGALTGGWQDGSSCSAISMARDRC